MNILQLDLKLNTKQNMEKFSKYLFLNKWFKPLPIALPRVKAGSTSENLLNEIRKIIHSLYQAKEITKKVYNNIMNSIKV